MTHTYETVRRCSCCTEPAMGVYGKRAYCAAHRPSVGRPITLNDVEAARRAMSFGSSLNEAARSLGVMATDLDLEMWRRLGLVNEGPRRYAPDFEDVA